MSNSIFKKLISLDYLEPILIAEMSGNHQNSIISARHFVDQTLIFRPDIIKFQVYKPDTITLDVNNDDFKVDQDIHWSDYKNLYSLYKKAHTPWEWIDQLVLICKKNDLPWFASPFDNQAVDFLETLKCPAYKLASPEITDIGLIKRILQTKKPIIISSGVATLEDLDLAVDTIKEEHTNFAILKCTSAYPSPFEDLNLSAIRFLQKRYNCKVGFSDHTIGEVASISAVALGAKIIEKHFKMDDDKNSIDNHFSMNISELSKFKKNITNAYMSIGEPNLNIPASVIPSLSGRRSLYISKPVKIGEKFNNDNVKSIRPSFGMHPKFLSTIIGMTSSSSLKVGDRLTEKDIKEFENK